jgi:hypothetical protein
MSKGRLYYASAVLNDGRLAVFGGEYTGDAGQTEDNTGEIYDPATNKWTPVSGPPGWSMVGDAPCAMLPNGKILLGSIADNRTALFDPKTLTWSDAGTKLAPSAEESWVLLRDGSVLTVDCDPSRTQPAQKAERWVPGKGWEDAGTVPVALCETASEEIGPGLALDDGRAFYVGATGHTAFYAPGKGGKPGTWEAGPDLPKDAGGKQFAAKDAPAALLPNGHVLVTASAVDGTTDDYGDSTAFFDIDPTVKPATVTAVPAPNTDGGPAFEGRMMLLPDGKALYTQGAEQISTFDSGSTEIEARRPSITDAPERVAPGATFELSGRRLNGASGSVGYGDDSSATISYPIVRLTDKSTGNVYYATTHDHSTMGLTTGKKHQSTQVTLPADLPPGKYEMQVVASGVASHPWSIHVKAPDKD